MSGRRFLKVLVGSVAVTGAGTGLVYLTKPELLVAGAARWQRYAVGFRCKSVRLDDGFVMHYAEKGRPRKDIPTMVMLHGFSGSLDAAIPVVQRLNQDAHVIAIDAPGHGKTYQVCDDDLRPKVMAQRINQFLNKTEFNKDKFHLVGWAMGGTIAGFYAAQYPQDLKILTIIAPGMHTPVMLEPAAQTVAGDTNVLLPSTDEEKARIWKIVMYKKYELPKPVRTYLEQSKQKRRDCHVKVMKTMIEDAMGQKDNLFITEVSNITTPTQIVWGDKDGLLDVSGAHLLASTIGCNVKRKDIIPEAGHAFYAEEPHTLAGLITAFQMDYRMHSIGWEQSSEDTPGSESSVTVNSTEDRKTDNFVGKDTLLLNNQKKGTSA